MKAGLILAILLFAHHPSAHAQSTGTFTAIASMTTARNFHTATLLQDGRVLIAGGQDNSGAAVSSTEIYDPVKQTFSPSGNMKTARFEQTATLLPDGRVLMVGGDAAGSAELFDPVTGSFTPTGSLLVARVAFNATLLNSGKVLITGGVAGPNYPGDFVADAELYDPASGAFTSMGPYAGSLDPYGFSSTSTLLPDGTVLFATEPRAEVYNPGSAAFSLGGSMLITTPWGATFAPEYIEGQTATLLLSGKVLTAGGEQEDTGRFTTALLFDPASGAFAATGSMVRARDGHTATLFPDGTVLMAGGESQNCDGNGCFFSGTESSTELYDPVKGAFAAAGNMTARREWHTATLLNSGDVLLTGGVAYGGIGIYYGGTATAEIYHPSSPSASPVAFAAWHASTGQLVSSQSPAAAGEILSMYISGLAEGGVVPPQVAVAGRLGDVMFFGDAPGFPGYFQVNFRVPNGVTPNSVAPLRLSYLGRSSNAVTLSVQ